LETIMSFDADNKERQRKHPDPWYLPEIVSIEAIRVHFKKPVLHAAGPKRTETSEAVELRVRTVEEFPIRALSPALFIGDVVVNEYSAVDKHLYRFVSYETQRLKPGTRISLGWFGLDIKKKTKTKFTLELLREETR